MLRIPSVWRVLSGDTLWKIAQATGTSVQAIVQANTITNPDQIQVGTVLIIPTAAGTTTTGTSTTGTTYTVKSGDTLWKIAQLTGVSVQALIQANNLTNPDQLSIGQVLKIPAAGQGTTDTTGTTGSTAGRQDVAVVLSDGSKVVLPYTFEDSNGMKITFNSMTNQLLSVTVTNADPVDHCIIEPKSWYLTAAGGYEEPTPVSVDSNLEPNDYSGNLFASIAPGQSITGTVGFGAFSAQNGLFTLHFGMAKENTSANYTVVNPQDTLTFATGTNASGATTVSAPTSDETVTANAAQSTINVGGTDEIWLGTSPIPLTGTPTYQITAAQGGDASTASVNPTTGMFTAQVPGQYTISATVNGVKSTTANSAVINVIGPSETIDVPSTYQIHFNPEQNTLSGVVKDQNGTGLANVAVSYSSDNPSVVSSYPNDTQTGTTYTDQNGNFQIPLASTSVGTANLTITVGSVSKVVAITVLPAVDG